MDWTTLITFFQDGDNENQHFLSTVEKEEDFGPLLVSFANKKNGGRIIIGVDILNFHLIGTLIDKTWINEFISNHCNTSIKYQIESFDRNDKQILILTIPESKIKPITFDSKCYLRVGKEIQLATLEEEKALKKDSKKDDELELKSENIEEKPKQKERKTKITHLIDQVIAETAPIIEETEIKDEPVLLNTLNTIDDEQEIDEEEIKEVEKKEQETTLEKDNFTPKLNVRQELALKHVQEKGTIKNKEYRALFSVSHKTAHLELVELVAKGYLVSQGLGRSTCYILSSSKKAEPVLTPIGAAQRLF